MPTPDAAKQAIVFVTYEGTHADRFDESYYVDHHLPFVLKAFAKYGLESAVAFFPKHKGDGTVAIGELRFADEAKVAEAWASDEAKAVLSDVPHFTELKPQLVRPVPAA